MRVWQHIDQFHVLTCKTVDETKQQLITECPSWDPRVITMTVVTRLC